MKPICCDCERCKQPKPCKFYGHAGTEADLNQNDGEWLCEGCVPERLRELDEAIAGMRKILGDE